MYPPSDPWGPQDEPTLPDPPLMYGRAPVPPAAPLREATSELPPVGVVRRRPVAPRKVSWQHAGKASRRTLYDGWGFTAFGLLVVFCGWAVWAAAGGRGLVHPLVDLALDLVVGALVFVVLRGASRLILQGMMGRRRPHARWAHFFTGAYLCVAGVSYFAHSSWLIHGVDWIREQSQRL